MSAYKPLAFVGGSVHKYAGRIASPQWEAHKADIVREFQAHGIPYTRQWMLENRGFEAT